MRVLKKDNGHTLVEMILVFGLVVMLLFLLWTSYLSIHRTYIKAAQKAQNLEEARMVVNFLTDNFQKYEAGSCEVIIEETGDKIEDNQEGTVKKVVFQDKDGKNKQSITYDSTNKKVAFQTQEIGSQIHHFGVKRSDRQYDFIIEVKKEGRGGIPDQIITVGTTVNVAYMED